MELKSDQSKFVEFACILQKYGTDSAEVAMSRVSLPTIMQRRAAVLEELFLRSNDVVNQLVMREKDIPNHISRTLRTKKKR